MTDAAPLDYAPRPKGPRARRWLWIAVALALSLGLLGYLLIESARRRTLGKMQLASAEVANLMAALDAFATDTGRLPTQAEGLGALITAPPGLERWKGPYLSRVIRNDPWGRPYGFGPPKNGRQGDVDVWSVGPDGTQGTADDIIASSRSRLIGLRGNSRRSRK